LKREEKKQRKELERNQKLEGIKRLKNLKKKEIYDKMNRLKTVAGDEDLSVNIDDLDADFDPKEYDRRMQVKKPLYRVYDSTSVCEVEPIGTSF
jgi:protein KRI1